MLKQKATWVNKHKSITKLMYRTIGLRTGPHKSCLIVAQNRLELKSILKWIIWCGKQTIALRGHRDDDKQLQQEITKTLRHYYNFMWSQVTLF